MTDTNRGVATVITFSRSNQAEHLLREIEALRKRVEAIFPASYEANAFLHERLDQLINEYMGIVNREEKNRESKKL